MTMARLDVFERAIQKADPWIDDLREELGWDNRHQAYEALGVVLHVLRDRLPVPEAVALGAQLPLLLRGLYYQNWDVSVNPEKYRHGSEFLRHVRGALLDHRMGFVPEERLVEAVAGVLFDRLSEGEFASVRRCLPSEIRAFFGAPGRPDARARRRFDEERAWDKFSV
jgi:uncharacterized protein (DUF2267 family)